MLPARNRLAARLASRLGPRLNGRPPAVFRLLPGGPQSSLCGAGILGGSWGETLTCTRASGKYAENGSGVLTLLSNNQPAVEPKGLLVEAAATNLILRSAQIANGAAVQAPWGTLSSSTAVVFDDDADTAPDGTASADKVSYPTVSGAGAYAYVSQGVAVTAAVHTFSVWIRGVSGSGTIYLYATPDNITFYRQAVAFTTSWQRVSLTTSALTATTWYFAIGVDLRDGSQSTQSAQSVYLWGAQVELGSFASSYIATAGSTATRNQDVLSVASTNFPIAAGTVELECVPLWSTAALHTLFDTRKAAATDDGVIAYVDASAQLNFLVDGSTTTLITSAPLTWTAGTRYRVRCVWGAGNLYLYRDEVLVASNTTGIRPMPTQHSGTCWFGNDYTAASAFAGHISNFSVRR